MVDFEIRQRYMNDPVFCAVVNMLVKTALDHDLSIKDFEDALKVADDKLKYIEFQRWSEYYPL